MPHHVILHTPIAYAIDWTRPWFAPIRDCAERIVEQPEWRAAMNVHSANIGLTNHRSLPISFVEQTALPAGMAYEAFISSTGQVPTRNNLHDLFNALVWLSFPRIKRELNALQAAQIAVSGIGTSRGPARDAATIFDENAALLVVREGTQGAALIEALRGHHWHVAFLQQRADFTQLVEVWPFGHALMEKLVTPYKSITAHAWVVTARADFFAMTHHDKRTWLDAHVATELSAAKHGIRTDYFTPLPLLGVPGWWPNQDRQFYEDRTVFRPKRIGN